MAPMILVGARSFRSPDELEKLVVHAATMYEQVGYAEDFEGLEVTDPEYDELYRTLKELLPESAAFDGTSPSEAVITGGIVVHDPPMTSIEKADGAPEERLKKYQDWMRFCAEQIGIPVQELEIADSFKRDGVALRINYDKGKLISGGLRPRDGINGTDVTRHLKYIKGVPKKLPLPLTLSLSGEIECLLPDLEAINAEREAEGEEPYKNPRNYVAGCMGRDDAEENKNARLRITFYSISSSGSKNGPLKWDQYYKTETERAEWARNDLGIDCFVEKRPHRFDALAEMEAEAKSLPFYVDGVILKINNLAQQQLLGHHGDDPIKAPRGALAWKFEEETAEAVVSSIEWNASRTGRVVPTAIFDEPFILADTENTRATANNYGWMASRGLGPGARVKCKKGGKIIPNIMEVLEPVDDVGAPRDCPACNSPLALETSGSGNRDLRCHNPECGAKHVKTWVHYFTKMGGKGLGLAGMEKILRSKKVLQLADFYRLTMDDLTAVGFSERQAVLALATIWRVKPVGDNEKLKAAVEKVRGTKQEIEAWKFFGTLGIPGAGDTAGKALVPHFGSIDAIRDAAVFELVEVAGIGQITAESIREWFDHHGSKVDALLEFVEPVVPAAKTGGLSGKNFVLTGSFTQGKDFWKAAIEGLGGNVQSKVGKTTDYLVQEHGKRDGTPSGKEADAAKHGTAVISVADLERLLQA